MFIKELEGVSNFVFQLFFNDFMLNFGCLVVCGLI